MPSFNFFTTHKNVHRFDFKQTNSEIQEIAQSCIAGETLDLDRFTSLHVQLPEKFQMQATQYLRQLLVRKWWASVWKRDNDGQTSHIFAQIERLDNQFPWRLNLEQNVNMFALSARNMAVGLIMLDFLFYLIPSSSLQEPVFKEIGGPMILFVTNGICIHPNRYEIQRLLFMLFVPLFFMISSAKSNDLTHTIQNYPWIFQFTAFLVITCMSYIGQYNLKQYEATTMRPIGRHIKEFQLEEVSDDAILKVKVTA